MSKVVIVNPKDYDLSSEDMAMLQALYSRSLESVTIHLDKVKRLGSGGFMATYYIGYGHSSIADTASVTVFIEGISLTAAKAFQESPLYNGQECSTRYIDFGLNDFYVPTELNTSESYSYRGYVQNWLNLYNRLVPKVKSRLSEKYPLEFYQSVSKDVDSNKIRVQWENAIKAASFDICRAFLPLGMTTNLSLTLSLRQMREHLQELQEHPLKEVSNTARQIFSEFEKLYPNSFKAESDPNIAQWTKLRVSTMKSKKVLSTNEVVLTRNTVDEETLKLDYPFLNQRPRKGKFPREYAKLGAYTFNFKLDYGSYRDLQRHRDLFINSPTLDTGINIHQWYLTRIKNLGADLYQEVLDCCALQNANYDKLCGKVSNRYLLVLGCEVDVEVTASVPEWVYVLELRSSSTVHPTLRNVIKGVSDVIRGRLGDLVIYEDCSPIDQFCVFRGSQVITYK